ncbi:SGNH/GDSL hydrolase family protein [Rhodococcus sp. 14C212]|uniref:SGNH/GDSL hydrolase family protein n=1 Tax=Rhodococcus sp. 14C212 TaxID=2711209 RepID=UPI0013EC2F50|nr:SGNH/GDSL hydrolase family protein [Rhodococcus sp. 14C212]NGP05312.1 SGNH/GDSL hydrolase family protein [Rhodococcus sp. 14C212]
MNRTRLLGTAAIAPAVAIAAGAVFVFYRKRRDRRDRPSPPAAPRGRTRVIRGTDPEPRRAGFRYSPGRSQRGKPAASRRARWDLAAIVSALAIAIGLVFVSGPTYTADAPSTRPSPEITRLNVADDSRPSVLFVGDSYTAGTGLAEMSYACTTAVRMGWLCNLAAVPGTGYISGGPANRFVVDEYIGRSTSFAERIPRLAAVYAPDVVVLDGGRNDLFPPTEDVFQAMVATVEDVRRTWPAATVVFVRPRLLADPTDDLGFDDAFIARLATEPAFEGVLFVDPIAPLSGTDTSALLAADRKHPNPLGVQTIGAALTDSLEALGPGVRS